MSRPNDGATGTNIRVYSLPEGINGAKRDAEAGYPNHNKS